MGRTWIIISAVVTVVIISFAIFGYSRVSNTSDNNQAVLAESTGFFENQTYFSEDAKVMFFYSNFCGPCQREKTDVLPILGEQGYRVKPMNVGEKPELGAGYNIEGTPTFIAANGDRLTGYQELPVLKSWLDVHK